MKKIKLECWWTDTQSLHNRFEKQFFFENNFESISLVNDNPDYTIVFGRTEWDKLKTPKERTFYISQEPLWSPNQPIIDIEKHCSKIYISDKRNYPDKEEYIETLLPMFYAGRGESDHREEWDWSSKMFKTNFDKNECIGTVVSNNYNSHFYHLSNPDTNRIIYKERTDISTFLIDNFESIHTWGTFRTENNKNCHGEAWNKLVALKNFKFSICFENTIQKNYISEKFWDCVLTDTVPIYFGCNNISEYIDENCFINLTNHVDDFTYIKNYLEFIVNNCDVLYEKYLVNLKKLKQDFLKKENYNLLEFIKKIIE
jgi:hypothetical protein